MAPDEYLPILYQAFPGQERALQRLTLAYMRMHYGDHQCVFGENAAISESELTQLRADFRAIQETPRQAKRQENEIPG